MTLIVHTTEKRNTIIVTVMFLVVLMPLKIPFYLIYSRFTFCTSCLHFDWNVLFNSIHHKSMQHITAHILTIYFESALEKEWTGGPFILQPAHLVAILWLQ